MYIITFAMQIISIGIGTNTEVCGNISGLGSGHVFTKGLFKTNKKNIVVDIAYMLFCSLD